MPRLALVCSASLGRVDAIRDHSFRLARAIEASGVAAHVWLRQADGSWLPSRETKGSEPWRAQSLVPDLREYDALIVEYNPFMYGRWGFAPWLPLELVRLKRARRGVRIALMVHEPYVPMANWKWILMGAWQRAQLEAIRLSADIVFASIEAWTRRLHARRPFRPAVHLPVGSNLPDRRSARTSMREHLEVADNEIVLASLSTGSAGRLVGHAVRAANALVDKAGTVLLQLGAGAPDPDGLSEDVRLYRPGRLAAEELASWLSAADVFLAPFVDGVSTRRGSMMAALQHALPVVGTTGRLTDSVLAQATDALTLVPVNGPDVFADAVVELAHSGDDAARRGRAGRSLYESTFDWPVVAGRLLHALGVESVHAGPKVVPSA